MALPVKNALYATMANALQSMAGILVVVLLARPLGAEEFGRLLLAISFSAVFAIVIEFGFRWYATKEVSQQPGIAARIAGDIFNAQLLLALAATVLAVLAARILDYPPRTMAVIAVIWISAILVSFTHVTRSLFRGLDLFPCDMAVSLVLFAAMVLALLPPLFFHPTTLAFAVAILAARGAASAAGFILFRKKVGRIKLSIRPLRAGRLLAATLAYGTQIMIFRLLLEWNTIVLHQFSGNIGVGIYQAAFRFMLATMVISDVLLQAFFPLIARLATNDSPRFVKTCATLNRYLLAAGAYLAMAFFVFAAELIRLAFGAAYAGSVPALKILALAVLVNFLSAAPSVALIALGRQATRARASILVLACNAAAAFILIPGHGAVGAALATLAAFVMHAALNTAFVRRETGHFLFDRRALATALLALAGGMVLVLLKRLSLPLGLAAYALLGGALFLAATSSEEKKEMLRALRLPGGIPPEVEP
jgi:O-antigen/teichoic acid export membrane protein